MAVSHADRVMLPTARPRFHLWMALVFVAVAFGGFAPSYWAPLAVGSFHASPMTHVHGAILFSWPLFYLAQTAWVAAGRTPRHRAWGLAGISLFTLVIASIVVLRIAGMRADEAHGYGEAGRRFAAIVFIALPFMIGLFALAIANVQRPEVHRRLMYVLMCSMLVPAIARTFIAVFAPPGTLDGGPPPPFVSLPPAAVAILLIGVGMLHDWRTRGRPHRVYALGALALAGYSTFAVLVSDSDAWLRIARALQSLGG